MRNMDFISEGTMVSANLYNDSKLNTIVIILTGDSPNGLMSSTWKPLIDILVESNYCVFAFDFYSQGKSSGSRDKLNISKGIENLKDGYSKLKEIIVDGRRIAVIGSSFGGAVILNSPFMLEILDALILKSPASILYECYENEHGGLDGLNIWEKDEISKVSGLSYNAYLDSLQYCSYSNLKHIKCPVKIIHGDLDETVPLIQSKRIAQILGSKSTLHILKGVKHDYKQENALNELNLLIINFLNQLFK